jgi:hypothetical protein
MELTSSQLKSLKQILEKMDSGSNIFTPKSTFKDIKTFTDDKSNLYLSYVSTTPEIDGFTIDTGYMMITPLGTIDYLSLFKKESELEEMFRTLKETTI